MKDMLILEEVYAIKYKNDCIYFNYRHNMFIHTITWRPKRKKRRIKNNSLQIIDEENIFKVNCTTIYEYYNFIFFFFV